MSGGIPAITGAQLVRLLKADGWVAKSKSRHGIPMIKKIGPRTIVTVIPMNHPHKDIPQGTLSAILGVKQTRLGRNRLQSLIDKYSLK